MKNIITKNIGKYQFDKWFENNKWYVKLFNNNAKKSINRQLKFYVFSLEERANKYIETMSNRFVSNELYKEKRKKERINFKNPAKVGDILDSSWGYDQTNIDFYQVIKVKEKSVVIQEIGYEDIKPLAWCQDEVTPKKNGFLKKSEPMKKLVKQSSDSYCVKITSYSNAYLWDGRPKHRTSYA